MAKKPNDQSDPPEPADLFDWADAEGTESPPAEPIGEAELFDFTDPVTEPMDAIRAAATDALHAPIAPPTPSAKGEDAEDIFGWDTPDTGAASFVGKRPEPSESSILSDIQPPSAANSGWLDSGVKIGTPPSAVAVPPPPHGPSSSGVNLHDPDAVVPHDSESSIFGQNATELSSRVEFDLDPAAKSGDMTDAIETASSASIWDETDAVDAERMAADRELDDAIDWEVPAGVPDRQSTLRAPRPEEEEEIGDLVAADAEAIDAEPVADDADLASWLAAESRTAQRPAPTPSTVLDTAAGLPISPMPAPPKKLAAPVADSDFDLEPGDDPVPIEPKRAAKKPVEKKAKGGAAGWIGGGVAGLLIGGAGVFGLSQAGILPGGDSPAAQLPTGPGPQKQNPQPGPQQPGPAAPQPLTVAQAAVALDKGDAVAAKAALDAMKPEELTPATQAARGHARLLARVQELAEAGTDAKADDKAIAEAETDLKAVFDKAADAKSADEQAAVVRAALNLGLLKELSGDNDGAIKVYTDALTAIPSGKRQFETALKRLKATAPAAKTSRLAPRQVEVLLVAVAVLLQGEPAPKDKGDDEPGYLFWDAVNAAASSDFATAADLIGKAKATHEARRRKLVGRGPNPKSDPAEQIFTNTCDQLKELYALKATIYGHPVAGAIAKTDGAVKAIDKLADAQAIADKADKARLDAIKKLTESEMKLIATIKDGEKVAQELVTKKDELKDAMQALDVAEKKAKANETVLAGVVKEFKAAKLIDPEADDATALAKLPEAAKVAAANGDTKKLSDMLAVAKKDLDASQASLKTAMDDVMKAKAEMDKAVKLADDRAKELADTRKMSKANDDALGAIIKEFKAAKLIDADADAATALAKLPDATKKATAAAMSGDAEKAAKALLDAKKETEVAMASLKKAETDLAAAKKDAKDAMELATKEVDAVKVDAAKTLKTAQDDAAKALKAAQDETAKAKKEADDKAKMAAEQATADAMKALKAAQEKSTADAMAAAKAVADAKVAADKLSAAEADFARQLAAAKAAGGSLGPIIPAESVAQEKAVASFLTGTNDYAGGRYAEAEANFRLAIASDANDARYHYYLGLALFAQGNPVAEESFKAGGDLERRNRPNARDVGESLERVQGFARKELAKYRPQ